LQRRDREAYRLIKTSTNPEDFSQILFNYSFEDVPNLLKLISERVNELVLCRATKVLDSDYNREQNTPVVYLTDPTQLASVIQEELFTAYHKLSFSEQVEAACSRPTDKIKGFFNVVSDTRNELCRLIREIPQLKKQYETVVVVSYLMNRRNNILINLIGFKKLISCSILGCFKQLTEPK
jgi:hypothetical protein